MTTRKFTFALFAAIFLAGMVAAVYLGESVAAFCFGLAFGYCLVDRRVPERQVDNPVVEYWHAHYLGEACTLCGNSGFIDTRGVTTYAGVPVGRVNYCICPNGQAWRENGAKLPG